MKFCVVPACSTSRTSSVSEDWVSSVTSSDFEVMYQQTRSYKSAPRRGMVTRARGRFCRLVRQCMTYMWRRNRGATGALAETARAKVCFRTAMICQVYRLITHIARLQESSPEELKMLQNSWWPALRPDPTAEAYSAPQTPTWWFVAPSQELHPAQLFGIRALLAPAMSISFRRTPLVM